MQGAAVEFAKQVVNILNQQECTTNLFLEASDILVKEFVLNPSQQEAEVFGSFVMSGDQTENDFSELAPKYSLVDWLRLMLFDRHPHADVWFPASIARDNAVVRKLFKIKEIEPIRKIRKISGLGKIKQKLFLQSQIT